MGHGSGGVTSTPHHPTHSRCGYLQRVQRAQPLEGVRGDLRDLVVAQVSETQREKVAWSPLLSPHVPPSSRWVPGTTPSTGYTELGVSETPSQCCHVGHPCHSKCPVPVGVGGCGLTAVAGGVKGAGVQGELVGAAHLHPPQLLVGGEGARGDGLDAVELQSSARRRRRDECVGLAEPQHPTDRAGGLQDPQACSKLPHQSITIRPRDNLQAVVRAFSSRERCHGGVDRTGWGGETTSSPPAPWVWGWLLPPMCFAHRPSGGFAP